MTNEVVRRAPRRIFVPAACLALAGCASLQTEPMLRIAEDADTERIRVVIPEVWELANVILSLTSYGSTNSTLIWRQGSYYAAVRNWFDRSRNHESMDELQLSGVDPLRRMYSFRENSVAYGFVDGRIVRGRRYGEPLWSPNLFRERLAHAQAFSDASDFRAFYAGHRAYYDDVIARYRQVSQIDSMVAWLEREFGDSLARYTVVISPLSYGSHSANWQSTALGREGLMFVSGPDVDGGRNLPDAQRHANVQRIIFTEMDHLFVNPASNRHAAQIQSVFSNRSRWTTDSSSFYNSPLAVFNEYMTWAAFTLWLEGRAPEADFETYITRMEQQMEQQRRFIRFGDFNRALLALYRTRSAGTGVVDLYPAILDWARTAR